jgi:hypothetical protein
MTRHYPRSHPRYKQEQERQQQQQKREEQHQKKERGWYCKEHDMKYLCDICGYDSVHNNKQKKEKYYFIDD